MKLYHYKNCSTCKKAIKFLDARGISYQAIEIDLQQPSIEEMQWMCESYEGKFQKLFNTSGKVYRDMDIKSKISTMTEKSAIALLRKDGMLIKRPFLIKSKSGVVGFKQDEWNDFLEI